MAKPAYMPVKVADGNINAWMQTHVSRTEYKDKIKTTCRADKCWNDLPGTYEHYEMYGNWCQSCNSKLRARKLTESELNQLFRGQTNQLYHDLYKDTIDYPTLQKLVAKEMELSPAQNAASEVIQET